MTPDGLPPTFYLFPNLPTELQIKIWQYALPGPRVIQVHYHDSPFSSNGARPPAVTYQTSREAARSVFKPVFAHVNHHDDSFSFQTSPEVARSLLESFTRDNRVHSHDGSFSFNGARPPALLHTCRTSREVARSVFDATFACNDENKALPPIYIDLVHDTIYLITPSGLRMFPYAALACLFPDIAKAQSLAVELSSPTDINMVLTNIFLSSFKRNLSEIVFVVGYQSQIHEFKHTGHVRFSKPEAMPWCFWQSCEDTEADVTEQFPFPEGCVVRVMEAKIISDHSAAAVL
jgi:hypothetical protein